MAAPSNSTKKRLAFVFASILVLVLLLVFQLARIQLVNGEKLKKMALDQWTRGMELDSERGVIYDRNGDKLAVTVSSYTLWANPEDIEDPEDTAKALGEVLDIEDEIIIEILLKDSSKEKIEQWITQEEANELREMELSGIEIEDVNRRFYPYEDLAPYVLGFTNIDGDGLSGIESSYDEYLSGRPGKWIRKTDAKGKQMPYDGEKIYEAQDGLNAVLTIDETIQRFAEEVARESSLATKAKNVSIIVMEPDTGDILAMANMPHFNPNDPRKSLDEGKNEVWKDLTADELQKEWYDMWRNFAISDAYEPGSTFKAILASAAIEENVANPNTSFFCNGFIKDIPGQTLKCSRWYNPHRDQTLTQGMETSCNVVFVNLGRMLGKEKYYDYMKAFGFGELTGIELPGEQAGIMPPLEGLKEIQLATMSYGHGISITPIQLVNAMSAIGNGGNLMKPRLVSRLIDDDGNIIIDNEPEIKRQVISKSTSDTMLEMLAGVVSNGTGSNAYIPGYSVAGKTGTAQKPRDGAPGYATGKYIGSFVGLAPAKDPKIAVLVIVDEPEGVYYGGSVAAPVAGTLIEKTLAHMDVEREYTEKEKDNLLHIATVPNLIDKTIEEAGRILVEEGFKYTTESNNISLESKIIEQFPEPGTELLKGSIIDIYLEEE